MIVAGARHIFDAFLYGVRTSSSPIQNSTALQNCINAASLVNGVVWIPPGNGQTYEFAKVGTSPSAVPYAVLVPSNVTITGGGMYETVLESVGINPLDNTTHFCIFLVEGTTAATAKKNISFRYLGMISDNTTGAGTIVQPAHARGILFLGNYVSYCGVDECRSDYFWSGGMTAYCDIGGPIFVRNCTSEHNGENGLNINTTNPKLINNTCNYNASAGMEIASTSGIISGNHCKGNGVGGISMGGLGAGYSQQHGWFNVVSHNVLTENTYGLGFGTGCCFCIASENQIFKNNGIGLQVTEDLANYPDAPVQDNLLANNVIYSNGREDSSSPYGVYINATRTTTQGNRIRPGNVSGYVQKIGVLLGANAVDTALLDDDVLGHSGGFRISDYSAQGSGLDVLYRPLRPNSTWNNLAGATPSFGANGRITRITTGNSYTPLVIDEIVEIDVATFFSVILPPAHQYPAGQPLKIVGLGNAATFNIPIAPGGADTLNSDYTAVTITSNYGSYTFYCDGISQWICT